MVDSMLRFIRPTLPRPEEWLRHIELAYEQKRFSNFGPVHSLLEERLTSDYAPPSREAVLVASGTAGITATLMALEIHGRVLIPSFTFAATVQAVRAAGCVPVFCDVCPDLWEMSPETLRAGMAQDGIACVLTVRSYGLCRDLTALEEVCREAKVPLVVDAAAALGGETGTGALAGGNGIAEVFSLHSTKVFSIGEGGVVFASRELAAGIRTAINFGITQNGVGIGFNGKLNEFACAVGLAMADRVESYIALRRRVAASYIACLESIPRVKLPRNAGQPPWQSFPIQLTGLADASPFVERALELGLEVRRYYRPALHTQDSSPMDAPVSKRLADTMICLPIYSDMTTCEQNLVMKIVSETLS